MQSFHRLSIVVMAAAAAASFALYAKQDIIASHIAGNHSLAVMTAQDHSPRVAGAAITAGLVGYWSFDEGSGTSASGGSINGTLTNGPLWTSGKIGGALSFDGVNDFVGTPAIDYADTDWTIAVWVKTSASDGYIVGNGDSSDLRMSGGKPLFSVYGRDDSGFYNLFANSSIANNQWHHVVAQRQGTGMRIYIDGSLDASLNFPATGRFGFQTFAQRANDIDFYSGLLDELYFFNRSLSASEITALFTASAPAPGDTVAPVISNGSPSGTLSAGTTSTTLSVSTNEVATCKYGTSAGVAYAAIANTFSSSGSTTHTQTISGLTNGASRTYYIRCQDLAGNATTSDYTVTFSVATIAVDTTPPTISISAPASGSTVSGSAVPVSANASDNSGVVGVQFKLDGNNLSAEDTSAPYGVTWNSTVAANGSHSLTAIARDAAGNQTTSAVVSVTVANAVASVPVITSFNASPSSIVSGGTSTLSWSVSGATTFSINQNVGVVTGTSQNVSPVTTTTYTLTATNSTGSSTAQTTITVTAPVIPPATGTCNWYVATNGSSGGNGSSANPWDIKTAFSHPSSVLPGHTICVRGGTYYGRYISTLTGTSTQPITIKAYPGERVTLDGNKSTTITASVPSSPAVQYQNITVADPTIFSYGLRLSARIGGVVGEEVTIERQVSGNTIEVIRGWNGSCPSGTCASIPAGTTLRMWGNVLTASGAYTRYQDLEVTISGQATRISTEAGSDPKQGGIEIAEGILDSCNGCKYINNVIHDVSNGFGSHAVGSGSEFYGNISYYNGWFDQIIGSGKGHGFYIQNATVNPVKLLKNNISFKNFNFGFQSYGDAGGVDNLTYDGNVAFDNTTLAQGTGLQYFIGRDPSFLNPVFENNMSYSTDGAGGEKICAYATQGMNAKVRNNYFSTGRAEIECASDQIITGNTFIGNTNILPSQYASNTFLPSRPTTGQQTFVFPNQYESGRANVIVYNWGRASSVSVSVTNIGLSIGQTYEIRDAQNYYGGAVATGTYTGNAISIPMTSTAVASLIGQNSKQPQHTTSQFGAFVLLPTSSSSTPPPPPSPTDTTPPIASAMSASAITQTSAIISWTTNEAADSQVRYGLTASYGASSSLSSALVTTHSVSLSGLTAGTTYHYRVDSRDEAGNLTTSADFTFTTLAATPPVNQRPTGSLDGVNTTSNVIFGWAQDSDNTSQPVTVHVYIDRNAGTSGASPIAYTANEFRSDVGNHAFNFPVPAQYQDGQSHQVWVWALDLTNPSTNNQQLSGSPKTFTIAAPYATPYQTPYATPYPTPYTTPGDTVAPIISNIIVAQANLKYKSTAVTWTTDELSDSQVEYGPTNIYGNQTPVASQFVTAHTISLAGLLPGTTYHFRVKSRDGAGNLATSADQTFRTLDRPAKPPKPSGTLSFTAGSIQLAWQSLDYELCASIGVYRSNTAAPQAPNNNELIASLSCSSTSYHDEAVTGGATYYYSLFVFDDLGAYSDPLSGSYTAPASTPPASGGGGGGSSTPPVSGGGGGGGGGGSSATGGGSSSSHTSSTALAYQNMRLVNASGTYYVITGGYRYGVTNPGILFSYGLEFGDALPAVAEDHLIPYFDNLKPGDGALVKKPNDSTVFLIADGQKFGFVSGEVFASLGYSFQTVLEVTSIELDALPRSSDISDSSIPHKTGAYINQDGTIYRVQNGVKQGIPSIEIWNSMHKDGDFSDVVPANSADRALPQGTNIAKRLTS
jgi:hypothetical protein